jgi:hypothetical protein
VEAWRAHPIKSKGNDSISSISFIFYFYYFHEILILDVSKFKILNYLNTKKLYISFFSCSCKVKFPFIKSKIKI